MHDDTLAFFGVFIMPQATISQQDNPKLYTALRTSL